MSDFFDPDINDAWPMPLNCKILHAAVKYTLTQKDGSPPYAVQVICAQGQGVLIAAPYLERYDEVVSLSQVTNY